MDSDKDLKSASQPAVEDSEEEENEILEESPCGRWLKRREEVEQSNIPGIDATYLAMDTEEGVEVVWNEVRFSERKYFKAKEEIISEVFDRLIQLEHPNIVKLHKYWIHKDVEMPRVIFITEYMSSGSLKQFLRKTKRHDIKMALQAWRRWCTQTLSALCYLHSSQPPIIHGNINCDTIFISYNGLIKIGAIAPDAIHRHVKTVRADSKSNLHFIAPELGHDQVDSNSPVLSPAVDIYSFGMCALEMAALEISADDDSSHHITEEVIQRTIDSLENPLQKNFIQRCLQKDPGQRPSARDLLFHPIIFEVPTLRLFCAHSILNNPSTLQPEQLTEDAISRFLCLQNQCDRVVAEIKPFAEKPARLFKQSDFPNRELEKFLDEVKNGACPLTAIMTTTRPPLVCKQRTISPEVIDDAHKLINTPDNPYDEETRRVVHINCCIQPLSTEVLSFDVKIIMKLDDKINRQLTCEIINDQFIPSSIAQELVYFGFINKDDKEIVGGILLETFNESQLHPNHVTCCEKSLEVVHKSFVSPPGNVPVVQSQPVMLPPQPTILISEPTNTIAPLLLDPSQLIMAPSETVMQVPAETCATEPEDLSMSGSGSSSCSGHPPPLIDHNVMYNPAVVQIMPQPTVLVATTESNLALNDHPAAVTDSQLNYAPNIPAHFPTQQESYSAIQSPPLVQPLHHYHHQHLHHHETANHMAASGTEQQHQQQQQQQPQQYHSPTVTFAEVPNVNKPTPPSELANTVVHHHHHHHHQPSHERPNS